MARIVPSMVLIGSLLVPPTAWSAGAFRRELGAFCIFAQRSVSLKDIAIDGPCNVGVNCARPTSNAECGTANFSDITLADGSQIGADHVTFNRPGASVAALFHNSGHLTNVTVREPPAEPLQLPIVPGSCGPGCAADVAALEDACGFLTPFPSCDPTKAVVVRPGADCPGGLDQAPGNNRCDLAPGTYGDVSVRNDGKLTLAPGRYDVCALLLGKSAEVVASGVQINVADGGALRVDAGSKLGAECPDVAVRVKGRGEVTFGRRVTVTASICAPESVMHTGAQNVLQGQFIADEVRACGENVVKPCICPEECPVPLFS
jgi:hypothetical protein